MRTHLYRLFAQNYLTSLFRLELCSLRILCVFKDGRHDPGVLVLLVEIK
ncbi:hypothetical protein Pla100_33320 [Neorhodopirellula pilleata]|uniref:Uncharacterized protein n=1 Tax=Neorhodopirellula pilleata TaxID=2714738 RepID=A0A5C6A8H6_9BACT|nr:hypothetical protein Pla100_33320 [Neorhodopirellula pilleata]